MAENKTQRTDADVDLFIAGIDDPTRRDDANALRRMMSEVTGDPGSMWGDSIVGFGEYEYTYASGRSGHWFKTGFAPRKQNTTVYIVSGFDQSEALLARLGKHSTGKSCLYIRSLAEVDEDVLRELVEVSVRRPQGATDNQ